MRLVRIVGGTHSGRVLKAPPGRDTRPTSEKVREALFNILGSVEGDHVLDLFAGSGGLGIEALSRGAAHATLIENDRAAVQAIEANLGKLGAREHAKVRAMSAANLPREAPFDIVFADPPYGEGSGDKVVAAVAKAGWLAPGGWLAIETGRGASIAPGPFVIDAERDVGRARITLLRAA